MAVPSRKDKMIRNLMSQSRKDERINTCEKQFPDCPDEPNKEFCKRCPFWK